MNELIKELNSFLANLCVFYRKLQNYHWNITGKDFFITHEKLEEYYNDINNQIDEIAEVIVAKNCKVLATMKEYLETSQIKEVESKKVKSCDIWNIVLKDYETLIENCKKIKNEAENENCAVTSSLMDEYIKDYQKKCWMISQVTNC